MFARDNAGNETVVSVTYTVVAPAPEPGHHWAYHALSPSRLLDTRSTTALGAGQTIDLAVTGRAGVPDTGVGAVVLNITATDAQSSGYLTSWPKGEQRPLASTLNFGPGTTVANLVIAKIGADGSITLWNANDSTAMRSVNLIIDIVGWMPS